MVEPSKDERRRREAQFHDQWASEIRAENTLVDETFTAPTAVENRHILAQFGDVRGKRILDYGCGSCEGGIYLAKQGAHVVGIDVSSGMLSAAQALATRHGVAIETRRVEGDRIPAEDGEFDLVYGNGVLHHVDLDLARRELSRVMTRDGTACFLEPLTYNPAIDVYRRLADTVRTPDEKPLSFGDVERFKETFEYVSHREFWLTTLSIFLKFYFVDRVDPRRERYWKKIYTDAAELVSFYEPLRRLDELLLAKLPILGHLCWTTVITVRAPRR